MRERPVIRALMGRGNRGRRYVWGVILLALALTLTFAPAVVAQEPAPDRVAVILLLDNSASMDGNDPLGLRFTAAKLFVALLDEGDRVGIVRFATQSQPLTDGMMLIRSVTDRKDLVRRLEPSAAGGWTDVKAAFAAAQPMLAQADLTGYKAVILLLTDGQPEIPAPYPAYEEEALALARDLGLPIMAIVLTPAAQSPFLNRVVEETTGIVVPANDASALLDAYLELLGQVKGRTVLGDGETAAPGMAPLPLDPALAPYVEAISFVISKPISVTAQLIGPDGHPIETQGPGIAFALNEDPRFAVLTVERPSGGAWGFRLEGDGAVQARAILRSRLRIELVAPRRYHEVGQPMPIVIRLIEEGPDGQPVGIIGEASFSAEISRPDGSRESLDRFYDDGTHGDMRAGDGLYTRLYVNADLPGTYTIAIHGWKGVVPVEYIARVEVIPFPEIVVDQPSLARYAIRDQAVLLQIHLEGGVPPLLDRGVFVARVSGPSGIAQEIEMAFDGRAYQGTFLPTQDGVYEVEFAAKDAAYKGLSYTRVARTRFEARIVPAIAVDAGEVDLGAVEIAAARRGMTITVNVSSTSARPEALSARLEGMPGLILIDGGPFSVPADGETSLLLRLRASPEISPGPIAGRLVFTAREGVDLEGAVVPVRVRLFQPALRVLSNPLDLGSPAGCFAWSGRLTLSLESTSLYPQAIHLRLVGVDGLDMTPTAVQVVPGTSQMSLQLTPRGELPAGEYNAWLVIEGREGLRMEPGDRIPIHFRVAPVWIRCRQPLIRGGVLFSLILAGAVMVTRRIRRATRPPLVTGTLRHWPIGHPEAAEEIDLTIVRRPVLTIGRGEHCDVVIPDPELAERHAVLRAEKAMGQARVILEPLGKVRRGYHPVRGAIPLHHGLLFTMGSRECQYLSDEGE